MERLFECAGSPYCKNGEGWSDGTQGSGSGRAQKCERPGASRGRSPENRMPRVHGKALGVADGGPVVELLGDKDNWWDGTMRQAPEKWTAKEWRKVYGFGRGGEGMASRTDRFIDEMFSGRVNPKDGYVVVDCKDPRVKRVLEFLVPLLYPEKPTRVTITVGNTIFGALSGERPVDWRIVVKDLVQRLLSGMGKSKAIPICPYIFHLYHSHELLLPATKKEYRIQEALVKHNVESEEEEEPDSPANPDEEESSDDSECENLTPSEVRKIQKQEAARLKKSPINKRKQPLAPKEPVANKRKSPAPLEGPDRSYQVIAHAMKEIREREREQQGLIRAMCGRLGNIQPDELLAAIDHLPSQKRLEELEAKTAFLQEKSKKASEELREEKEAHWKVLDKLNLSLAFNQKLDLRRTYQRRGQQSPALRCQPGPTFGCSQEGNSGPCGFRK